MVRTTQRKPTSPEENSRTLSELAAQFAVFRAAHRSHARVPGELREAALAAVDSGIRPYALQRLCGVSASQLSAWREARASSPLVRVLSVTDEPLDEPAPQPLELRLGPWSISIRLADLTKAVT